MEKRREQGRREEEGGSTLKPSRLSLKTMRDRGLADMMELDVWSAEG